MVEVGEVHVEALDAHRHIPCLALAVVRALGIDDPLVAGYAHLHLACRRNEVGRDISGIDAHEVVGVVETQHQVIIVVRRAGIDGNLLRNHVVLAGGGVDDGEERNALRRGIDDLAVYTNRSTLRITSRVQIVLERQRSLLRVVALVRHAQYKAGRLVEGHIALHGLVHPDAQLIHRDGGGVEHGARLIPLRPTLTLIGLAGHTTTGAEYEARIDIHVVVRVIRLTVAQFIEHVLGHDQHRVLGVIVNAVHSVSGAIDIDVHAGLAGNAERKANLFTITLILTALVVEAKAENGRELDLNARSSCG